MHRVDTPSAVTVMPTPEEAGTPGFFAKTDASKGQPATIPGPDFLNAVQEELCHVVESAGLAPDKSDNTQLAHAIQILGGGALILPSSTATSVSAPTIGATITSTSTGGAVTAGKYATKCTYNGSSGETTAGTSLNSVTVTGSTNTLINFANDVPAGSTSVNYYVSKDDGPFIKTLSNVAVGLPGVITTAVPTSGTTAPIVNSAVSVLASAQAALDGPGFIYIPPTATAGAPGDPVVGQTILDGRSGAWLSRQSFGSPQKSTTGSVMNYGISLDMLIPVATPIAVGQQVNGIGASITQGATTATAAYGTELGMVAVSCAGFFRNYRLGADATGIWGLNGVVYFANQNNIAQACELDVNNSSGSVGSSTYGGLGLQINSTGTNAAWCGMTIGGGPGFQVGALVTANATGILIGGGIPQGIRSGSPYVSWAATSATSSTNYASPDFEFWSNYWNGSASATDIITIVPQVIGTTNPFIGLTFDHTTGTTGGFAYIFRSGDFYVQNVTAATSSANYAAGTFFFDSHVWNGSTSVEDKLGIAPFYLSGANPIGGLRFYRLTGSSGALYYQFENGLLSVFNTTAATSSANQSGASVMLRGAAYTGSASLSDYFSLTHTLGSGANPSATLAVIHVGSTGDVRYSFDSPVVTTSLYVTGPASTAAAGQLALGSGTATSATAGSSGAPPSQVAGYIIANLAGTAVKVPYYNT